MTSPRLCTNRQAGQLPLGIAKPPGPHNKTRPGPENNGDNISRHVARQDL